MSGTDIARDASERPVMLLRRRIGLTRKQFARLVGCSHDTLYRWEARGVEPDGALLVILQALDKASVKPKVAAWLRERATEGRGLADVLGDLFDWWSTDRNAAEEA